MMKPGRRVVAWICIFFFSVVVGCSNGPKLGKVSGKVTYEGEPVEQATVTFTHEDGHTAFARTDENGMYELQFSDGRNGALIGVNAVSIETARIGTDANGEMVEYPETLPAKYHRDSEMTREILGGNQVIDFELTKE